VSLGRLLLSALIYLALLIGATWCVKEALVITASWAGL
jgi:hypothetical protein